MPTLLLTDKDVRTLLPMPECIEIMDAALRSVSAGESTLPLRTVIRLNGTPNAFGSMPAIYGSGPEASIGAKIITVFPGNDATPFDSHIGVVLLFDAAQGTLLAIADASSITAIRTSAVSGLATRILSNPDSRELAVLGAGVLARPHIDAVRAVRPIERVRVWSRSRVRAEALRTRLVATEDYSDKLEIVVCDSARDAVRNADVVCTITSARTPILEGGWLSPGTHVNAVGASLSTARELDTYAVQRALLFVDRRESTLAEAGDFLIPRAEGAITDTHIRGELGELSLRTILGRTSRSDITLFKSLGLAVEDVAALRHVYERARETGAGMSVELGGMRD